MKTVDTWLLPIDNATGPTLPPDIIFPLLVPDHIPGQSAWAAQHSRVAHGSPPPTAPMVLSPPSPHHLPEFMITPFIWDNVYP